MLQRFVRWILRPEWVVFDEPDGDGPELGLKIWGAVFGLYKGDVYLPDVTAIRKPGKREFGESLMIRG